MALTSYIPVKLVGDNLGKRHRHLNTLVNNSYQQAVDFSALKDLPENSPLDRLFKIDLAAKYKDIEYIVRNLKDKDMLYVSRALNNVSIIDLDEIIIPAYLEDVLYPEMTTTAVNKMKHWIEKNLKDFQRCEEFYHYYVQKNLDTALKFLNHCSKEFVHKEISNKGVLEKLTPHRLKVLCEKCPEVANIFYDAVENNEKVNDAYIRNPKQYYDSLKILLKLNGDIFLDLTEKYFDFPAFSDEATKQVMKHHRERFKRKPELYASKILDIKTLAKFLNQEEIKELVLTLARADYLAHWFTYKNVEPLIKALSIEERTRFKNRVFVDKDVGEKVDKCPYKLPSSPSIKLTEKTIFEDYEHNPDDYDDGLVCDEYALCCSNTGKLPLKKRCYKKSAPMMCEMICKRKTSLDQLFDQYRYVGFDKALYELRKKMIVNSTKHRQNMMLVLVSKSGGRAESLEQLLTLLTSRYKNEPENLRATIIRSLVRRCSAWRLPDNVWEMIVKFGHGVGLDGTPSTVPCKEGLHAVVIRSILNDSEITQAVWKAYMDDFSNFTEYPLNVNEKQKIFTKLPKMLLTSAKNDSKKAIDCVEKALDTLEAYKIRVDLCENLIPLIADIAKKNGNADVLLRRLYKSRIARKELFKENFALIQNNESYINALKHDISMLSSGESFEKVINLNNISHDRFFQYLSLYFNEEDGLAKIYLSILLKFAEHLPKEEPIKNNLARSIAVLSGDKIAEVLRKFDDIDDDKSKRTAKQRFASALKANAHLARPIPDIETIRRQAIGAKAIANRVLTCSAKDVENILETLLKWPRTQKLGLILSTRVGKETEVLSIVRERRPQQALKTILRHLDKNKLNENIWDVIIPTIFKQSKSGKINNRLKKLLNKVDIVPEKKKAEYCIAMYEVFREVSEYAPTPMLCNIENILERIDSAFIENVLKGFITKDFNKEKIDEMDYTYESCVFLHIRIIAKYLLLCKTESEQDQKWKSVGEPFLDQYEAIWKETKRKFTLLEFCKVFSRALKFSKVFLDNTYTSCLPMFEKIIPRMQQFILIHEYFGIYIHLHLTMLYFKSVRQSIKNNPKIFDDLPKNTKQGAEIVGRIFGKYVAHEITELAEKYVDSIIEIYKENLNKYLNEYFQEGDTRKILITNFIRSVLDSEDREPLLLAEHIYNAQSGIWTEDQRNEILKLLEGKKCLELKFFLYANMNKRWYF